MKITGVGRLQEYRDRHGYKARELAKLLDLTDAHLSQIINGKRRPGLATALKIEARTGIPVESWMPTKVGRSKRPTKAAAVSPAVA